MRVRTAKAEVTKNTALDKLFKLAATRRVAWIVGSGHVYADLSASGRRNGYECWSIVHDGSNAGEGFWFAVREDLIKETTVWGDEGLAFESSIDGLGEIVLVSSDDAEQFQNRADVTVANTINGIGEADFTYTETIYSVPARKGD